MLYYNRSKLFDVIKNGNEEESKSQEEKWVIHVRIKGKMG